MIDKKFSLKDLREIPLSKLIKKEEKSVKEKRINIPDFFMNQKKENPNSYAY